MAVVDDDDSVVNIIHDDSAIEVISFEPEQLAVITSEEEPITNINVIEETIQLIVIEEITDLITDIEIGPQGIPGLSAYEIAVDNGFIGTEADWLESLKGDDGAPADPEGYVVRIIAPSFIGNHRLVAFSDNGILEYASKDNIQHANKVLGITLNAANLNEELIIRFAGVIEDISWTWNWLLPIFLSTNGLMTQTPPATGTSLVVATPLTPTTILISIKEPIILI
jgi:hypothetical protein